MMIKRLKFFVIFIFSAALITFLGNAFARYFDQTKLARNVASLTVPVGFSIKVFAGHLKDHDLSGARLMTLGPDGNIYLSLTKQNKVVMVLDENHDGVADRIQTVVEQGLNAPHGLTFVDGQLYIANQDSVVKVIQEGGQWPATKVEPIIQNLPSGGHTLKTLKLGPDGYLYLNVGSSCNVCVEIYPIRATILRYTIDGKPAGALQTLGRHQQSAIWAKGLRNSQGFAWHPITKVMYATNEGADNRSDTKNGSVNDEIPPEHLNVIKAAQDYGWPYCWGDHVMDPNFPNSDDYCQTTEAPVATFTSHSTPIGLAFLHQANVPKEYQYDAIAALHGSWNRQQPSGYQLSRIRFNASHQPIGVETLISGWLQGEYAWGRPVDVIVGNDRAIYVSDDKMGVMYRLSHQ